MNKALKELLSLERGPDGYMTPESVKRFWELITESKEKERRRLARLPYYKKIAILEQIQRDNWPTNQGNSSHSG